MRLWRTPQGGGDEETTENNYSKRIAMPNDFSKFLNMQNKEVVGRRLNKQPANSSAGTERESVPASYADL